MDVPDQSDRGLAHQADLDLVLLHWGTKLADPAGAGWYNDLPTGLIDQDELDKVLLNWGNSPAVAPTAAGIPEPPTLLLAVAANRASIA